MTLNNELRENYLLELKHYLFQEDNRKQADEAEMQVFRFMKELGIVPYKDGNQWCALYGEDLQSGIAGFGATPYRSVEDLEEQFYTK